jgi:hypothetical protein
MKKSDTARLAINLKELIAVQRKEYKADMLEYNMLMLKENKGLVERLIHLWERAIRAW